MSRTSLPVYLVFFALAGASMHLHLLATLWLPATLVVVARAGSFWVGARLGTAGGGVEPAVRRWAFAGLLPQAGLALALAMLVERALGEVGPAASALVLAVIAMNELLMPIVVRRALESAGETGRRHEEASLHTSAPQVEVAGAHSTSG